MEHFITANIRSRPTRTFISMLAVAFGITIMPVIGGIASRALNDYVGRAVSVGADFMLQPSGSSVFYALSNAALPVKLAAKSMEVPGISVVTLLAMYATVFERTREIGILKSLGATTRFIIALILKESVMIYCLGALFGIGISEIVRKIIVTVFPTLQVAMSFDDLIRGSIVGLVAGTLGALYPAYKAARINPVRALSYE